MLQSPYFAQINQVTSVTLGVDFDQEQFITFRATATSPAIATLLRNTINSAVHQELPPNAPPQAKKMMELVGAATTVEVDAGNNSTVVTTMKKDPALLTAFGQMISSGVMAGQAAAQRAVQRNNLKEVALAMHNYHDAFGSLPIAKNPEWRGSSGPHLSWRVHILPFIGEEVLYKQFRLNEPWDSPHNIKLLDQMPRAFVVPGVQKENHTSIMTFTGAAGLFRDPAPGFRDVRDGTSNTIMVIQAGPDKAVPWTKPEDITASPENPFAAIGTVGPGFHAALCDGQVRFISANIEKGLLNGLINPADGQ